MINNESLINQLNQSAAQQDGRRLQREEGGVPKTESIFHPPKIVKDSI